VPPIDPFANETNRNLYEEQVTEQEEMSQKCQRSERSDRSFVRRALRRGLPTQDMEDHLLTATEFHRLNPDRDPIVYVRGLIDEEGSSLRGPDLAEASTIASRATANHSATSSHASSAKRILQSEAMARRYIQGNFEASDWLAVVARNRELRQTVQRITTARQIASPEFQAWLRHKNANGSDIYLSLNTLKEHARGRTKADVQEIRHLYLDLDEDGQQKLAAIYQNPTVPHPNYVLQTSPQKFQVIWRAQGLRQSEAEELLRSLAQRFGGDPAATDSTRVFRLPGFNNKKYKENFLVELATGTLPDPVYHRSDFRIEILPGEHGTTVRKTVSAQAVSSGAVNTQSERDWAYAIRHLRNGDNPELIIREIAAYRATDRNDSPDTRKPTSLRKANPRYYAERTVSRAMAQLGLTRALGENEIRSPENEPER